MQIERELYSGKAKSVYATNDPDRLVMRFRDDTSAFDGRKKEQLANKGATNNRTNAFIMQHLERAGIPTHFERLLSDSDSLVKRLEMIPVECVVRNRTAGSICRRLGVAENMELDPPTFEFFLKNDELHDPMVNEYHIRAFGWASDDEIAIMKRLAFEVNDVLKQLFLDAGIVLVDYKLEFGRFQGRVVLGDEFTADGCRLWDVDTGRKLDKDRFRQDLGGVVEAYQEVASRLGVKSD
jgi:phosphoribosylaminoimidazole-succinocarboxamide synthase